MSIEEKRHYVKQAYPGPNWARKVDRMSDAQVARIYARLLDKAEHERRP